jgi:hypothetical protein
VCTETPNNPPANTPDNPPAKPPKHHPPHHGNHPHDGNLLPLPEHRNSGYWATMIINETRKGDKGTISASKPALHSLYRTRNDECTPVEMVPGACVKLNKTLLETLYLSSLTERFRINYTVTGSHVECSDHYEGRAADLARFNGSRPYDRSLLHVFARQLSNLPGHPTAQLLGPGDEGHSGANAHWHIGISGPNNICA